MKTLASTFLFLTSAFLCAQTETMHPIDVQREICYAIDSNQTTSGMVDCENTAAESWDAQLNEYYKDLMKLLNREEQDALKESQRQWIEYRDRELVFYITFYHNLQGSMWRMVAAKRRCEFIRERALELKEYIGVLSFDE